MWFLIAVIWIAVVAGIFWAYGRKRKQAVSARAKELDALISAARNVTASASAPPVAAVAPVVKSVAAASVDTYAKKPRLLDKAHALFYLVLRTGLPDHEIFANLSLADVIEPSAQLRGYEREQSIRKLAQSHLDFVVCNKQLEIVAVLLYTPADASGAEMRRHTETGLTAAGIRFVKIDPAALPRHSRVRALVYGDTAPAAP